MSLNRNVLARVAFLGALALISLPMGNAQAPPPGPAGRGTTAPGMGHRGRMSPGMTAGRGVMAGGMMNLAGIPGQLDAPIAGQPFSATAEVSYGHGRNATVQLGRDAEGRTYLKTTLPFPNAGGVRPAAGANPDSGATNAQAEARRVSESIIVIADPVAHRQFVIYPSAKNIVARPLRRMWGMGAMSGATGAAMGGRQSVTTTLGTEPVAGQSAAGLKTVRYVPARGNQAATTTTREVWRSAALQLVLRASYTGTNGQEMSFTVQSLHTGAPQASLFELPAGYTLQTAAAGRSARGQGMRGGAFRGGLRGGFRGYGRGRATPPPA